MPRFAARASSSVLSRLRGLDVVGVAWALGGCSGALPAATMIPAMAEMEAPVALAAPTEDGSVYVSVDGPARATPRVLARMFKHKAAEACRGEYMLLSESASERNEAGRRSGRRHEGFVRCLDPDAAAVLLDDASDPKPEPGSTA